MGELRAQHGTELTLPLRQRLSSFAARPPPKA
jgi:hypothetical protein